MKVLVMGLGLHGGGVESARYLAERGASVTVTDLRDEKTLAPSIEKLKPFPIRFVLGRHEIEDFRNADLVIKNPGVRTDSPYLKEARRIETDISLFLAASPARIIAVTGSKGKSSTASALKHALDDAVSSGLLAGKAMLGGNISRSPLGFLHELTEDDYVVLELSSWQLGDLRGRDLLKPRVAVITAIMRDHLDRYSGMDAYVNDKRLICQNQGEEDAIVAADDEWGRSFLSESRARPLVYSDEPLIAGIAGGWLGGGGKGFARLWPSIIKGNNDSIVEVVPEQTAMIGFHQKKNLLAAALALLDLGMDAAFIRESLARFGGIEHRLEFFHESSGVRFYNDSAATIPEAAAAAISAFDKPPVLVTGGTDKNIDFTPLAMAARGAREIILLAGTGSEKLKALFDSSAARYLGPFDSLEAAIEALKRIVLPGDNVILSPGCASFGMFLNEFDRGSKWKDAVRKTFP